MAGTPGVPPRRFTHEQKVALVTEIDRRFRERGGNLRAIAAELGTTDTSYLTWIKAGIRPAPSVTAQPVRRRTPYSSEERRSLVSKVERLMEEGLTLAAACKSAGVSDESYRRWKTDVAPPSMRPVELVTALIPVSSQALTIVEPSEPRNLTLVAPGGYRIEGLTTESAAALLRALA